MIKKTLTRFAVAGALGASLLAVSAPRAQGQEISFLREFNISDFSSATAVAVHSSGLYVAGGAADGGFLQKHDLSGNTLWTIRAPAGTSRLEWPRFLAADGSGAYVLWGGNFQQPAFLGKYDPAGTELWTRQLFRAADLSGVGGMAVHAGSIYLVGFTQTVPNEVWVRFLRKYDMNGNEVWVRELPARDLAAVAADATGIYVAGGPDDGGFLRKLDLSGNELWTRELHSPRLLARHAAGVYVVATNRIRDLLLNYDSNGNELWAREFDRSSVVPASSDDHTIVTGLAAGPSGAYLVGSTNVTLPGACRSGFQDGFVRKYDPDGMASWTRQFSGSLEAGAAVGVAADASGVYVAGSTDGCGPQDCAQSALLMKIETQPVGDESRPRIFPGCAVNAASYIGGRISPGEIVTIFGRGIGPEEGALLQLTQDGRLTTALAETRVLFQGIAAPLIWVSDQQINTIVPYAVADNPTAEIEVEYQGVRSNALTMPVTDARPGIFTLDGSGSGHAAALNEDGSINSSSNPARSGSIIVLYASGEGLSEPVVEDGLILGAVLPKPKLPVFVTFCCTDTEARDAEVLYAGGAPQSIAGLFQINVRVPLENWFEDASEGIVNVQVHIGDKRSGFGPENYVFIRNASTGP